LQTLSVAVTANVVEIRARTRSTIMDVVKADGYGHGAVTVARQNAEHDVSLATATAVAEALRSRGFDVDELTIDRHGMWRRGADALGSQATSSLAAALRVIERADVVFPAVHGPSGDGTSAALCALAHTPMVGSGLRAGALGMDK
jgi:D-alanine-D-alanine ligase